MKPHAGLAVRARAAAIHLVISASVAALSGLLVLKVWFPPPLDVAVGGRELFFLVVSADLVLGPVLTFAIFDPGKGMNRLRFDLVCIGAVQLLALLYGLHTCYQARPVATVFEKDRFRVVTAVEVREEELPDALPAYRALPRFSQWTLGARPAHGQEVPEAVELALAGHDIGTRPTFWEPYERHATAAIAAGREIAPVLSHCPEARPAYQAVAAAVPPGTRLLAVPLFARNRTLAVLIDGAGAVRGHLPCDVFEVPRASVVSR